MVGSDEAAPVVAELAVLKGALHKARKTTKLGKKFTFAVDPESAALSAGVLGLMEESSRALGLLRMDLDVARRSQVLP